MKKLIFNFILVVCWLFSYTQPSFNKTYVESDGNSGGSVLSINGGYIVCGLGFEDSLNGWVATKIFKTDSLGNLEWMKIIGKISYAYYCGYQGSFTMLSDGNYAYGGSITDSNGQIGSAIICKVDTSGDTIWLKSFGVGTYDNFQQTKETSDKGLISVGWEAPTLVSAYSFYAVKTDSGGNELWEKTYGKMGISQANTVEQTPDNGYIMAGSTADTISNYSQPFVVKTDSNGHVDWQQTYYSPASNGPAGATQSRFGGYYMWGYIDTFPNSQQEYLYKLDSVGNIIWKHYFDSPSNTYLGQARELADSSIVLVGGKQLPGQDNDEAGWIIKVSNLGNEVWERYYPGAFVNNGYFAYLDANFYDFQPTGDKGFIITGSYSDSTTNDSTYIQNFWLVKTDSLGCMNGDCGYEGISEVQNNSLSALKIYPNPAQSVVTVEWSSNGDSEANIVIYDVLGREVKKAPFGGALGNPSATLRMTIDVSGLANGLYVVCVLGNDGEVFGNNKLAVVR